jgi:hypothetical protein
MKTLRQYSLRPGRDSNQVLPDCVSRESPPSQPARFQNLVLLFPDKEGNTRGFKCVFLWKRI